jgi:hypothetical protein
VDSTRIRLFYDPHYRDSLLNRVGRNTSKFSPVKRPFLLIAVISLVCGSCAQHPGSSGAPFGVDDYAFMQAEPYPRETALAQKRFQNFLRRANAKQQSVLAETPFVAVRAYQLKASEVPGLNIRMALGRLPNKATYSPDLLENSANVPVEFLLIFDQRTGRLAAPDGILIMGSPRRGKVGQFGGIRAIYADGGSW